MAKKKEVKKLTTNAKVEKYEMISPMLDSILSEMKDFSKKKQDEILNELKVKMINRVLEQVKELLEDQTTVQFLDLLDDETLPTNSDAVLIITQYRAAMDHFKDKYYGQDEVTFKKKWFTEENAPKKSSEREPEVTFEEN